MVSPQGKCSLYSLIYAAIPGADLDQSEVIDTFEILTRIKALPTAEFPFQVEVRIIVREQKFQQRLFHYANERYPRLEVTKRRGIYGLFGSSELRVRIVCDSYRDCSKGYLEDYLMNGFVYEFSEEHEAEEFLDSAHNVLEKMLFDLREKFKDTTNSKYYSVE